MKKIVRLLTLFMPFTVQAQVETAPLENDSAVLLSPVLIKGYESGRSLLETPAAVGYISSRDMQRFPNVSLLPSMNTIPGVRMEERSPGSYRLNIRGSLLRSPFGVRNIKVYWNDMPFTDAGGNTYLNLIDPNTVGSVEVLKGPGGSLYGANTGGVVVLHANELPQLTAQDDAGKHRFRAQVNGGSYGNLGEQVQWKFRSGKFSSTFTQSHLQADGYRANSELRKDVLQWNANTWLSKKDKLEWLLLYADLYYQTPGGLTLTQMEQNPRQARSIAIDQKAAIYNKTLYAGLSNTHEFNDHWSNTTSLAVSTTDFKNPFITNYEKRKENNISLRSKFVYSASINDQDIRLVGGAEWIYGTAAIDNFGNKRGVADTVQAKDRLSTRQLFPFVQFEWQLKKKLLLQVGASTNSNVYHYRRLTTSDNERKRKKFDAQFLPRLALLYPLSKTISLFATLSKGFSPATIAEIRSSDVNINTDLQPEFGWNYETGIRGSSLNNRFQFDATIYYFKLQQAIVRRVNSGGAEYFINSGGTDQKGAEIRIAYSLINDPSAIFSQLKMWSGFTFNDYEFTNYTVDNTDHSGKSVTGVPKEVYVGGVDVNTSRGFYLYTSINYTAKLPLNDANDEFAKAYTILQAKLGWKKQFSSSFGIEVFAGGDNLLDQRYSLGNDINAFGRRFYNPSARANYFGGLIVNF